MKSNCNQHRRDVGGIEDMKVLAEMIGDLHYETLAELFKELSKKLFSDAYKDMEAGKQKLGDALYNSAQGIGYSSLAIEKAWEMSKPFIENPKEKEKENENKRGLYNKRN